MGLNLFSYYVTSDSSPILLGPNILNSRVYFDEIVLLFRDLCSKWLQQRKQPVSCRLFTINLAWKFSTHVAIVCYHHTDASRK